MAENISSRRTVELKGLTAAYFDLDLADLALSGGDVDVPALSLTGPDDMFEQTYHNGRLALAQKTKCNNGNTIVSTGGNLTISRSSIVGSTIISGGRVIVDGVDITEQSSCEPREDAKVSLLIPRDMSVDHSIKIRAGNIKIDRITGERLYVKTSIGEVTLRSLSLGQLEAKTGIGMIGVEDCEVAEGTVLRSSNGGIEVFRLRTPNDVSARTNNGSISVVDSAAGHWELRTSNGSIDARSSRGVAGEVSARSSNGSVST